jgi:hypothetical protein
VERNTFSNAAAPTVAILFAAAEDHMVVVGPIQPHKPSEYRKPVGVVKKETKTEQPPMSHQTQPSQKLYHHNKMAEDDNRLRRSGRIQAQQQLAGSATVLPKHLPSRFEPQPRRKEDDPPELNPASPIHKIVVVSRRQLDCKIARRDHL